MKKRILAIVLCLTMVLTSGSFAFAAEVENTYSEHAAAAEETNETHPMVGKTVWVKTGTTIYKDFADKSKGEYTTYLSHEAKIVAVEIDEAGTVWYELEFDRLTSMFVRGCKYVTFDGVTETDPEEEGTEPEGSNKEVAVNGTEIKVDGNIPEDVSLMASEVAVTDYNQGVFDLFSEGEILFAFDISLEDDKGFDWQPANGDKVTVSMDIGTYDIDVDTEISVAHDHNGEIKRLGTYVAEDGVLSFETDGFSEYYFYVDVLSSNSSYIVIQDSDASGKISLKTLLKQTNTYTDADHLYCFDSSTKSSNTNIATVNVKKGDKDGTVTLKNKTQAFDGIVAIEIVYYTTKARYEKGTKNKKTVYLTSSKVSVNPVTDVVENDGVNVHLFNYGAAINDASRINKNGSGFLPFGQSSYDYYTSIPHRFKYVNADGDVKDGYENFNEVDGEATGNAYAADMARTLKDGYPYVKNDVTKENAPTIKAGSLKYLFDKDSTFVQGSGGLTDYNNLTSVWDGATALAQSKATSATGYSINNNNSYQSMHFATGEKGSGLFQNIDGYYYYNCKYNAAYFDTEKQQFVLYDTTVVPKWMIANNTQDNESNSKNGNFLPFNEMSPDNLGNVSAAVAYAKYITELNDKNSTSAATVYRTDWFEPEGNNTDAETFLLQQNDNSRPDLWFGVSADYDFYMPEGGKMYNSATGTYEEMIYQFTGDDDVFVYLDGVLILDIGGCHKPLYGTINFMTGEVVYDWSTTTGTIETVETTMYDQYLAAYNELTAAEKTSEMGLKIKDIIDNGFVEVNGNMVFKDYTVHDFDFFYLERGGNISSMEMKFNLEPIPEMYLTVEKDVEDVNPIYAKDMDYTFVITAEDASDKPVEDLTYTVNGQSRTVNANGEFTLKAGEAAIFDSIELGYQVKVEEKAGDYTTECAVTPNVDGSNGTNSTGIIQFTDDNKAYNVVFTNSLDNYDLTVKKELLNPCEAPIANDEKYNIAVTVDDELYNGDITVYEGTESVGTRTVENGVISLTAEQYAVITDIPISYNYSVVESSLPEAPAGYKYSTPKYKVDSGDVVLDAPVIKNVSADATVNVINELEEKLGDLTISKTGINKIDNHEKKSEFSLNEDQVTLYTVEGTSDSGVKVNMDVAIDGNGQITIKNLPVGRYTVTENVDWSWRYKPSNPSTGAQIVEVIDNETVAAPFINKRDNIYWLNGGTYKKNVFDNVN